MERPAALSVAAAKASLRAAARSRWRRMDRAAVSAAVTARLLDLPELRDARCVAAYVGMADEVDTEPLLAELHRRGVTVLLPAVVADGALDWRVDDPGSPRQRGSHGTSEPPVTARRVPLSTADVVIVPGLAFDPAGRRLGRGGGYVDRALAGLPASVRRIAMAPDDALVEAVPTEPHDAPVHVVVTPSAVITAAAPPAGLDAAVGPRLAVDPDEC